jgi:cephalosporin-C deacetylase-like acetyl esterase
MKQRPFGFYPDFTMKKLFISPTTMAIETVGNPPPEADRIRTVLQDQLPDIIASFNQVLQEQYGISGISVGGFTVVPESALSTQVTCDQDGCSIN